MTDQPGSPLTLSTALSERATTLADKIVLGLIQDSDEAISLAVDLLAAGFDGNAVVALAALSPGSRWVDTEELARAALGEVGIALPLPEAAGWSIARYWANQLKKGGPQTYRRASALWGLWWALGNPPEIGALVQLMDEWEVLPPGPEREAVEDLLVLHADAIIVAAERTIAGLE